MDAIVAFAGICGLAYGIPLVFNCISSTFSKCAGVVRAYTNAIDEINDRNKWKFGTFSTNGDSISYLDASLPDENFIRIPAVDDKYSFEFYTAPKELPLEPVVVNRNNLDEEEDLDYVEIYTVDAVDKVILPIFRPKIYGLTSLAVEVEREDRHEVVRFFFPADGIVDITELSKKFDDIITNIDSAKPLAEAFD